MCGVAKMKTKVFKNALVAGLILSIYPTTFAKAVGCGVTYAEVRSEVDRREYVCARAFQPYYGTGSHSARVECDRLRARHCAYVRCGTPWQGVPCDIFAPRPESNSGQHDSREDEDASNIPN